jgi:aspartate-semialdehyde dehydrogenase
VKFSGNVPAEQVKQRLGNSPGVRVSDLGGQPVEVQGKNETVVGRIRNHPADKSIIQFWVTADNVRKGAALNAVQILQMVAEQRFR